MGSITFKAPVPRPGGEYRKSIFVDTDEKEGVEYQLVFKVINTDPPQYKVKPIANYKSQNQLDGKLVNATRSLYVRAKDPSKRELLVEKLVAQQALT